MRPILLAVAFALALPLSAAGREPLPPELMQAKTVYIEMGGFVPTKSKGDHGAQASYLGPCEKELQKWGRLEIVNDPKQADIILRISSVNTGGSASYSTPYQQGSIAINQVITSVDVLQASSGKKLWTDGGMWVAAFTAKIITRDLVRTLRKQVEKQEKQASKAEAALLTGGFAQSVWPMQSIFMSASYFL